MHVPTPNLNNRLTRIKLWVSTEFDVLEITVLMFAIDTLYNSNTCTACTIANIKHCTMKNLTFHHFNAIRKNWKGGSKCFVGRTAFKLQIQCSDKNPTIHGGDDVTKPGEKRPKDVGNCVNRVWRSRKSLKLKSVSASTRGVPFRYLALGAKWSSYNTADYNGKTGTCFWFW